VGCFKSFNEFYSEFNNRISPFYTCSYVIKRKLIDFYYLVWSRDLLKEHSVNRQFLKNNISKFVMTQSKNTKNILFTFLNIDDEREYSSDDYSDTSYYFRLWYQFLSRLYNIRRFLSFEGRRDIYRLFGFKKNDLDLKHLCYLNAFSFCSSKFIGKNLIQAVVGDKIFFNFRNIRFRALVGIFYNLLRFIFIFRLDHLFSGFIKPYIVCNNLYMHILQLKDSEKIFHKTKFTSLLSKLSVSNLINNLFYGEEFRNNLWKRYF